MLNTSGDNGHPGLVPDFGRKAFSFSPLRTVLAVGLSCTAFILLRYVSSISTSLRDFITKGCWILSYAFHASIETIIQFLSFFL